jgi:DNA-binding GntR family transcriptional regulator
MAATRKNLSDNNDGAKAKLTMARKRNSEKSQEASLGDRSAEEQFRRPSGLTEEVYKRIRADIVALRIPADTRILADEYARKLGVSQTPIREALIMLESIGLVTKRRFVGYCTAPKFNREQFRRLFEIRRLLEPHAARMAAGKMDQQKLDQLNALVDRMTEEADVGSAPPSHEVFADQDTEFHALICGACDNILIYEALDRLHTHLHIFRIGVESAYAEDAKVEHMQIKWALENRHPDAAEKAMRAHIDNAFERLLPFINE